MGARAQDQHNNVTVASSILPAADRTTTTTGSAVDLANCKAAYVVVHYGTITDGTFTPSITSCATSGGSYTAESNVVGTLTAGTSAADETTVVFSIDVTKALRYVKVVLTASGSPATGGEFGASVVKVLESV